MPHAFRQNNFDLIRLAAAYQVLLVHSLEHLGLKEDAAGAIQVLRIFPGVPIFFFLSGFLISRSYERRQSDAQYFRNRVYRIYPALIVCTAAALLSVAATGYFADQSIGWLHPALWIAGQISFLQFYNPAFLRDFGTGVLNGSLWTITVELQFYLLVPLLYRAIGRLSSSGRHVVVVALILASGALNVVYHSYASAYQQAVWYKFIGVTFAPWLALFLTGVLAQWHFETLHRRLASRAALLLPMYGLAGYAAINSLGWGAGNYLHPALSLLLVAAVFSAAYSWPTLSDRLLHGNDLSYGVYIYHAPVLNLMMHYGFVGRLEYVAATAAFTTVCAALSWVFVERPWLNRKTQTLRSASEDVPQVPVQSLKRAA